MGKSYDYKSIMHYDRMAFTKNGLPTIVAIGDEKKEFGTKERRLSTGDIIEINALYDCTGLKLLYSTLFFGLVGQRLNIAIST